MGTLKTAWKVASAGKGGGGFGIASVGLLALLAAEAKMARNRIGRAIHPVPDPNGLYGTEYTGDVLRVAVIGDSSAAGYGVHHRTEVPGYVIADRIAHDLRRPVEMFSYAVVGARSFDLAIQVAEALDDKVDVAVILLGANDVTHMVPPGRAGRYMQDAVHALTREDVIVVVGTCPDLGTIKPILPPLRNVARTLSRRLATVQAAAVMAAGGHAVSIGSMLGHEFYANPKSYFGPDGFHPSAEGYRRVSVFIGDAVAAAVEPLPDAGELAG